MKCEEVSGLLELYIMGELDEYDSQTVEKHLDECNLCSAEYMELKKMIDSIRNLRSSLILKEEVSNMSKRNITKNISRKKSRRSSFIPATVACLSLAICLLTVSLLIFPSFAYKYVPELPVVRELAEARRQNEEVMQKNVEILRENEEIKKENKEIREQLESIILENERIKIQLKEINGEKITEVVTSEGVPEEDNRAVQNLVIDFIKAMYKGDLETIKSLGTPDFNAKLDRIKDSILMENEGLVIFRQITNAAFHDGKYVIFVRVNDTNSEGEADYQWSFELIKTDGKFLVDFVGMDA